MTSIRFASWNCHHGSLAARLAELAEHSPDIAFLQECQPSETLPLVGSVLTHRINAVKGIALGSMNPDYEVVELPPRAGAGGAVIAANVSGPLSFTAIGIWSQGPAYVDDVMRTLRAHSDTLSSKPCVVMGDLNSGAPLSGQRELSRGHAQMVDAFSDLGLVSAYHAFHRVDHGQELHPTYHHLFKIDQPWHIDYCFVPKMWASHIVSVQVVDGGEQAGRSDHRPLLVEISLQRIESRSPLARR